MTLKKPIALLIFLFTVSLTKSKAQKAVNTKYKVSAISNLAEYNTLVAKDPSKALVELRTVIPNIKLDIRYATANNFMQKKMYATAAAFLSKPAAEALKSVQQELNKLGLGLKIYDAYRPYSVTVDFYKQYRNPVFVASPYTGSRHNRGCAIDLTIINLKSGDELAMPTQFDDFSKKAHTNYSNLPSIVIQNRELLKRVMTKHGFSILRDEWWHFDYKGWRSHPIMNIPFNVLSISK